MLTCRCWVQSQLRDTPLTDLTTPILFVRGTKDAFCEHEEFEKVKARMTSSDVQVGPLHNWETCFAITDIVEGMDRTELCMQLQVHSVESGDHSLKAKGGKQAAAAAVADAIEAAVTFARTLADAASAADGTSREPLEQAEGSAPVKRKAQMDAEAAPDKPTASQSSKKRQKKSKTG